MAGEDTVLERTIRFWKMSGAGNDFIVLPRSPDALGEEPARFVRRVCRRGVSIGADGVLFVTPAGARDVIQPAAQAAMPAVMPGVTPGATPAAAQGATPAAAQGTTPAAARCTTDTAAPSTTPTAAPSATHTAAPSTTPGATLSTTTATTPSTTPATAAAGIELAEVVLVHYNADGGRSNFCGNGSRCAARFAVLMGFAASPLLVRTDAGLLRAEVEGERARIEVPDPSSPVTKRLALGQATHDGWFVLAGVPHLVLRADAPEDIDVASLGAALRRHPALAPEGANIDFVGPGRDGKHAIRTFERGVEGETLACGSGAIAAAAVLARQGEPSPLVLTPASGIDLMVEYEAAADGPRAFRLTGEARIVFEGTLPLEPSEDARGAPSAPRWPALRDEAGPDARDRGPSGGRT